MAAPFNQKLFERFRRTQWLAPVISLGLGAAGLAWYWAAAPAVWYWLTTNLNPPAEYQGKSAQVSLAWAILFGIAFGLCVLAWWVGTLLAGMG
ncbi:MAG: hypothetical protein CMJ94_08260 [Planctomycetes bacterium]|nr:hypothetical protein [Planctomycetota bacterium]